MKKTVLSMLLLGSILLPGCAAYTVRVNGYLDPGQAAGIQKTAGIHVVEDKDATNTIFAREIRSKIEGLLKSSGFLVVPYDSADYYLLYAYGIGPARTVTEMLPVYQTGGTATVTRSGSRGSRVSTIQLPSTTTYVPYPTTVYDRWVMLKIVDGKEYREGKTTDVWIGEVSTPGQDKDIREAMNYLLVAAFEHFGQNTERPITKILDVDDERVKSLMRLR